MRNVKFLRFLLLLVCGVSVVCGRGQNAGSGFVNAGNFKIFFEEHGQGEAMVFMHAGALDHKMWAGQVAYFSKHYRVITLDLPGHGLSTGGDTIMEAQEVVHIVLERLHVQKAIVVGSSLGAVFAVDLALAYPTLVDRLILESPGLNGWDEVLKADTFSLRLFRAADTVFQTKDVGLETRNAVMMWCVGPFRYEDQVPAGVVDYARSTMRGNLSKDGVGRAVWARRHAAKRVGTIAVPVMIVTGDKDVPWVREVADYIHGQLPGSRRLEFKGVAHLLNMEKADEFNAAVEEFLK